MLNVDVEHPDDDFTVKPRVRGNEDASAGAFERPVTFTEMCILAGVRSSLASRQVWNALCAVAVRGEVPSLDSFPVRMIAYASDGDRFRIHGEDASRAVEPFGSLVRQVEKRSAREYERFDPKTHADRLGRRAVADALGEGMTDELLADVWFKLGDDIRNGRRSRIGIAAIRTKLLVHHGDRTRVFVHRNDLGKLDWRNYVGDRRFMSPRQVVDHFRERDLWLGIVADWLMPSVKRHCELTGRLVMQGVPLGQTVVPTRQGLRMRMPAASFQTVERLVLQASERRIARDIARVTREDADTYLVSDHELERPSTISMVPA